MKSSSINLALLFAILISLSFSLSENSENGPDSIEELNEKVDPTYMENVISNLQNIMDAYVYSDISQNPPNQEYFSKVNIQEELSKIEKSKERPFYEFYRDIKKTLNKLKDYHLDIVGNILPLGGKNIQFSQYSLCLPFKLHLDYEKNKDPKIYIEEYSECSSFYDKDTLDFIKSHLNISLDTIEGTDAFDYIQDFGKEFYEMKNPHAHFSYYIRNFHSFYLNKIPLLQKEIDSITFNFNDKKELKIKYHIIKPENIFDEHEKNLINKEEFDNYFSKEIAKAGNKNIFDIKKDFLKTKNLYNEIDSENKDAKIKWTFETENGELKCRVDEENKLNIFYQTSFGFSDDADGESTIVRCARLFYSNNYKIVGIESNSFGGSGVLIYLFTQLIQSKIDVKFHMALRKSDLTRDLYNLNKNMYLNENTCLPYESWEDFLETDPDDYGNNIKHYRTKIYNFIPKYVMNNLKKVREEFEKEGKLKKPTDILIFTDSVSHGGASFFIKNLQNTGGAIIAGYLGNPKNNAIFDASQGPSGSINFGLTSYYANLASYGFEIKSVTIEESFEGNYQGNLYPREYIINKVDERTNIYHYFDDSSYEEFITEAKTIFKKYNEDGKCNNNTNLLLENNECTFEDDEFAHGGYTCGDDGKWTKTCKKIYCNIGYYLNPNTGKCEVDICTEDKYIDINEAMEKEIPIEVGKTYVLSLNNDTLAYFIDSPVDDMIHYQTLEACSKFCGVQNPAYKFMYINYYKKLTEKMTIKVTSVTNTGTIMSVKVDSPKIANIQPISEKIINIVQVTEKNYFYADSYDNYAKVYFGEYDEGITINDITSINSDFFPEVHNKIIELNPDKIYIFFANAKASSLKVYFFDEIPDTITLANGNINLLYLKQGKEYQLDFSLNILPFLIKLNPVKNAQFDIVNDSGRKETVTTTNKYYNPGDQNDQLYNGKLKINNIQNEDVLIEVLYSLGKENTEVLSDRSVTDKEITKQVTLIEYNLENDEKNMEIYLTSNDYFQVTAFGGLTKNNYFYYSPVNIPQNSQIETKKYFIKLNNPLKDIATLEENEKYKLSLMVLNKKDDQKITLTYYYNKNPIDDLYEDLEESYIDNVISNIITLISSYSYTEIAQNPPQPEGFPNYNHEPIDLVGALNNIKRQGRKFYDFYRELRAILGTVRDLHFRIFGLNTPSGIKLDQITACLPFMYYVDKDSNDQPKVYIKYNRDCAAFYTEEQRNYIQERCDNKVALKLINNKDPFDYIQEWGRIYRGNKSPHAHFTLMKTLIYSFYLRLYPYTPDELRMTFEFETNNPQGDSIDLDYFIFVPNIQNMKLYQNFDNFDKTEFDVFFENELKKNRDNVLEPNIFEMIHKFKVLKGIIEETPETKSTVIEWTYQTPEENGIKCRVDEENKINIFVQGSFSIEDETAQEVMYNCTRDFYKNDYKIIGIQNRDGGGWAHLCLIFHQLVQIKTQDRAFKAAKLTDYFKRHVLDDYEGYVDVTTCKPFKNIDDLFTGTIDDFSTKEKTLLHERSKVFNYIDKDGRKKLQDIRKEFEQYGHLKRPTDIIIYTDSFSYSATSSFIKGFQYTGGAIVVGYNGNPKLSEELFDGSQSPASVTSFDFSDEYKNLDKLGIVVSGITFAETYDDYYIQDNPIPREYLLDPVDDVVDIYGPYTDDDYQLFIDKAQEIFKKYNEDGRCNEKNKKLLLDPNNGKDCYTFDDDEFAHGGYLCGDNGKWTTTCRKYYCDIGYYYNQYKGKCERDICANDAGETDIYLNGEYNDTIILNNENNMEYIFHINNSEYTYFFESAKGNGYIHYTYNYSCPNLCIVQYDSETDMHYNKVYLNYYRNATEQNIVIKIYSIKDFNGKIFSIKAVDDIFSTIDPIKESKSIYIFESFSNYISYISTIDNKASILYTEYKSEMTISDILDVNKKYFKEFGGKINDLRANTMYILAILSESYNYPVKMLIQPKRLSENIEIKSDKTNFLYLSSDVDYYILDFDSIKTLRHIELSRLTLDSELIIKELETGEEVKINSGNLYYTFNEAESAFKGKIAIKIINGRDALIEFIFKYKENNAEVLADRQYINYKITKPITIVKFDKNNKDKDVTLSIFSNNEKKFKLTMVDGFTKGPFYHYNAGNMPSALNHSFYTYDFTIHNTDLTLEDDESLYLALFFDEDEINDDFNSISITKLDKYRIDDFNVDFPEEKCKTIVDNVIKLMEDGYIYTDIIKNPPNPEYFGKVDLISDLKNVETKDRKFYDFFRDIRRIIGKMKDGHLNIIASKSPNGYDLKKMTMCLPFSFIIKGETKEEAKIYIQKYEDCLKYFNIDVQKFVERHLDTPLIKINNTDPFDYIQNIQIDFNAIHNVHGQFSRNMNAAHKLSINRNPLTKEQFSNIEFVFKNNENNDLITLDYYLYYVNPDLDNNLEFINLYNKEIRKETNTLNEINILDVENKFYKIKNNINNIKDSSDLDWQFSTTDPEGIKCRVDEKNKVNVFKQTTFYFLDKEYDQALEVIDNCTEAFYKNDYPIIGIESNNGGGIIEVSLYFQQFLQAKILQRTYFSTKVTDLIKKELESDMADFIEFETGKPFKTFEDMKEIVDDYGNDIKHHRSKIFGLFNSSVLKQHKKRRQNYFKNLNLKKPTEIIIFTDSFSYSSTSFFIKGLQETGAAITVGYKGNPKSSEFFEASHSPSAVTDFNGSDIYNNLTSCGFEIIGTTFFESFNYSYQDKNPIPREYLVHPVDERVDIFQNYDDSLYDKFISEAKKIFEKYKTKCNKDNLKLLLDPNNKKDCYKIKGDSHAHGGYKCNEKGEWSDECVPYYCDIGYYFDVYKNKCMKDKLTESDSKNKLSTWAIVLICIGCVLILAVIAFLVFRYCLRKKNAEGVDGPLISKNSGVGKELHNQDKDEDD